MRPDWEAAVSALVPSLPNTDGMHGAEFKWPAVAAALCMVEGRSLAQFLPAGNIGRFVALIGFLHRVRLDVLAGRFVGPWGRPDRLSSIRDIVLLTRESNIEQLKKCVDLRVCSISRGWKCGDFTPPRHDDIYRTVVLGPRILKEEIAIALLDRIKPFLLIIDKTAMGMSDPVSKIVKLCTQLTTTPILIVGDTGDDFLGKEIKSLSVVMDKPWLQWRQRTHDEIHFVSPNWVVHEIPDTVADKSLVAMHQAYKEMMDSCGDIGRQRIGPSARRLLSGIASCVVPLDIEEGARRAGSHRRFVAPSLAVLIREVSLCDLSYAKALKAKEALLSEANTLLSLWKTGKSGKALALPEMINTLSAESSSQQKVAIVVANESQLRAVREWLSACGIPIGEQEQCRLVKAQSLYRMSEHFQHAILCFRPGDGDGRLVCGFATEVHYLAYPFEKKSITNKLNWWDQAWITPSSPSGDKFKLLNLDFNHCRGDHNPYDKKYEASIEFKLERTARGTYTSLAPLALSVDSPDLDWLETILVGFDEDTNTDGEQLPQIISGVAFGELIQIRVEERARPEYFSPTARVRVFESDHSRGLAAAKLEKGMTILIPKEGDSLDYLDVLFDHISDGLEVQTAQKEARRWEDLIEKSNHLFPDNAAFVKAVMANNPPVQEGAIRSWRGDGVYAPRDKESILAVARACNDATFEKSAERVYRAIKRIRGLRVSLARQFLTAKNDARGQGRGIALEGGDISISVEELDDMIELLTVKEVNLPTHYTNYLPSAPPHYRSVAELIESAEITFNNKLFFTGPARNSAKDSPFTRLSQLERALEFLGTEFYGAFVQRIPLDKAAVRLYDFCGATYAANLNEITVSLSKDYDRQYKGRKADMGKHLCLGDARDPRLCLRIHFEWDSEDQIIAIHHVGRHLQGRRD